MRKDVFWDGRTPTHAEILKELRSEWRQFKHLKQVAEREMEIRKERFTEVEQDAMKELGEKFLNENQIFWDEPET